MPRTRLMLFVAVAGFAGNGLAQDEEPDLSFLEYLGSWQESDEEWLIAAEMDDERNDADEDAGDDEENDETNEK